MNKVKVHPTIMVLLILLSMFLLAMFLFILLLYNRARFPYEKQGADPEDSKTVNTEVVSPFYWYGYIGVDNEFGCQYIRGKGMGSGIIPRLDREGNHVCVSLEKGWR